MWWTPYALTAAALVVVAIAGALATDTGPWYRALEKPPWQPPDWLFGPAWTTIYLFIVAAVGQVWNHAPEGARGAILAVTAVNLALNLAWSELFFRLRRPAWALVEVVPLALSIVAMMAVFAPHRPLSAWLLLPYLLWVCFAAVLNLAIVRRNPAAHRIAPEAPQPRPGTAKRN